VARLHQGTLREYTLHRPDAPDGLGDIHIGRVTAKIPAMAGAFVELAGAHAFLPDTDGAATVNTGDLIAVRITRAALAGKGPRIATCAAPQNGARMDRVALLARGPTPLDDLQAAYPDEPLDYAPFDDALEAEIEALSEPTATLHGGLRATFSPTPALTAIDLDMAQATAGGTQKASAQIAANREALPSLVRQIVLRNLSGAILVDLAGMPTRARRALAPDLQAALATDRLAPRLAGFSALGFAEISRPRLRPPLHELTASPLGQGLAALRCVLREARAAPARRLTLRAPATLISALENAPLARATLARLTTHPLVLRADPTLTRGWFIEDAPA
jgi:hypothetical protein